MTSKVETSVMLNFGCKSSHKTKSPRHNKLGKLRKEPLTLCQEEKTAALTLRRHFTNDPFMNKGNYATTNLVLCSSQDDGRIGCHHNNRRPRQRGRRSLLFASILLSTLFVHNSTKIVDGFAIKTSPSTRSLKRNDEVRYDRPSSYFIRVENVPDIHHRPPLIGIIGRMGPASTLCLHELVFKRDQNRISEEETHNCCVCDCAASGFLSDSQYTPFLLYNNPQVPNNNMAALGLGPSSKRELSRTPTALQHAGADIVAFACTTANSWQDQVSQHAHIPILDLLGCIAQRVQNEGHKKVGLLYVDGTHVRGEFSEGNRTTWIGCRHTE